MFDLSLLELAVIAGVGLLIIKPEDMPQVVRGIKSALRYIRDLWSEVSDVFSLDDEPKSDTKMIKGDDGRWYESYAVDDEPEEKKPES